MEQGPVHDPDAESVEHARAIAEEAAELLDPLQVGTDMRVSSRRGAHVVVLASPAPNSGVSLTVRPRRAPTWMVQGASVILRPKSGQSAIRFGALDERGHLLFRSLERGLYDLEFRRAWWLDDHWIEGVSGNGDRWTLVREPVVVQSVATRPVRQFVAAQRAAPAQRTTFLSADASLRYEVREDGGPPSVRASVRSDVLGEAHDSVAACIGIVDGRIDVFWSPFAPDEEGWRVTRFPMHPSVLVAIGGLPQRQPASRASRSIDDGATVDDTDPLYHALVSHWARKRRLGALDLAPVEEDAPRLR